MSFSININLIFIDSFQFSSSLLDSLVKSQEFDSNILVLVKQKGFSHFERKSGFEKLKENCQAKKIFIIL